MEFLNNQRFRKQVKRAAEINFQTSHETGFRFQYDGGKLYLGSLVEGVDDMIALCDSQFRGSPPHGLIPRRVIGALHFHPVSNRVIVPSRWDIKSLIPIFWRGEAKDWEIIGQVDYSQKKISLLVIERDIETWESIFHGTFPEIAIIPGKLEKKLGYLKNLPATQQEKVNRTLTKYGFQASLVSFSILS